MRKRTVKYTKRRIKRQSFVLVLTTFIALPVFIFASDLFIRSQQFSSTIFKSLSTEHDELVVRKVEQAEPLTVMLLGTDDGGNRAVEDGARSDTMMLMTLNQIGRAHV